MITLVIEYADGTTKVKKYSDFDKMILDARIAKLDGQDAKYQNIDGNWQLV